MAEWIDIVFEKSANYLNKINKVFSANAKVNNYEVRDNGDEIGWDIEYEPVWANEEKIAGWIPKIENVHGKRIEEVLAYLADNYEIIIDNNNSFDCLKPAEKRGLYDLYIDNHMDIPDTISKDSPCYKQFMKEKERK